MHIEKNIPFVELFDEIDPIRSIPFNNSDPKHEAEVLVRDIVNRWKPQFFVLKYKFKLHPEILI